MTLVSFTTQHGEGPQQQTTRSTMCECKVQFTEVMTRKQELHKRTKTTFLQLKRALSTKLKENEWVSWEYIEKWLKAHEKDDFTLHCTFQFHQITSR
jgi:hypothetical protein